jgi:hypothetical protein
MTNKNRYIIAHRHLSRKGYIAFVNKTAKEHGIIPARLVVEVYSTIFEVEHEGARKAVEDATKKIAKKLKKSKNHT